MQQTNIKNSRVNNTRRAQNGGNRRRGSRNTWAPAAQSTVTTPYFRTTANESEMVVKAQEVCTVPFSTSVRIPGNPLLLPVLRLSQLAALYETFKWRRFAVKWIPTCGTDTRLAISGGTVSNDSLGPKVATALAGTNGGFSSAAWQSVIRFVNLKHFSDRFRPVRSGDNSEAIPFVYTVEGGDGNNNGYLCIEYEVILANPVSEETNEISRSDRDAMCQPCELVRGSNSSSSKPMPIDISQGASAVFDLFPELYDALQFISKEDYVVQTNESTTDDDGTGVVNKTIRAGEPVDLVRGRNDTGGTTWNMFTNTQQFATFVNSPTVQGFIKHFTTKSAV